MLRLKDSLRVVTVAVTGAIASTAQAGLEFVSFDGVNGRERIIAEPELDYVNNTGDLTLYISGGIDRSLRVKVKSSRRILSVDTTSVININDRLNVNGREFYGKAVQVSAVNKDADYTIIIETLSLGGELIGTDEYTFGRDTVPPEIAGDIYFVRNGYSAGSIDVFGNSHATKAIAVNGVTDEGSGIDSAQYYAFNDHVERVNKPVNLNVEEGTVSAAASHAADPNSFPDGRYTIGFEVVDKAGNSAHKERVSSIVSQCPSRTSIVKQVFNENTKTWENYQRGMTVFTNPVKVRYGRLKSSFAVLPDSPSGWHPTYGVSNSDETYNYYDRTINYPQQYSYFHFYTASGKVCYTDHFRNFNFTLAEGIDEAPSYVNMQYITSLEPGRWINSNRVQKTVPYSVDKVRLNVRERKYRQKVWGSSIPACYVEPGETQCESTPNIRYTEGRGYRPYAIYVSKDDGSLALHSSYLLSYWDMNKPEIVSATYSEASNSVAVHSLDNDTTSNWTSGMWRVSRVSISYVGAKGSTGSLSANSVEMLDFKNRIDSFDLSQLEDDVYNLNVSVQDSYGNEAQTSLSVGIDNTDPELTVTYEGGEFGSSITDLNDLAVAIRDDNNGRLITARLYGSIANENVYLPIIDTTPRRNSRGLRTYTIEKPKIFPTLADGETYGLELIARDDFSNETVFNHRFSYEPSNLIVLETQSTLPVSYLLRHRSDEPVAQISSKKKLTVNGGMLATGRQSATVTNRGTSHYSINIDTAEGVVNIPVGGTVDIVIDLGPAGSALNVPVYPGDDAKPNGQADLLFEIPLLTSKWQ